MRANGVLSAPLLAHSHHLVRDVLDDVLVGVQHPLDKRTDDLLEGALPIVRLVPDVVGSDGLREVVEIVSGGLDRKKDNDGEDVESVVDGGRGEGALELRRAKRVAKEMMLMTLEVAVDEGDDVL